MVSAIATTERFPVGLGYLMASRAFLAGVSRVGLHHHYAMQSGFVQDELEKLVERPLRLLHVVAHSTATNLFQFLQYNGPSMFHGVVHDLLGHLMIFVFGASGLLIANLVKQTPLPKTLQIRSSPAPDGFGTSGMESQMKHLAVLRVG